jgi:hypothetical protein
LYLVNGDVGFEAGVLRQGDILKRIPFPRLELRRMQILGELAHDLDFNDANPPLRATTQTVANDAGWITIQLPARFGFFVVTSHCCELELRQGKMRPPVLTLARLRPIPAATRNNVANFASLRANKDSSNAQDPGYKDLFYLEPHVLIDGQDWSVHFNQTLTLLSSDFDLLIPRKILQMDDKTRAKFKTKVAFSIGKYTDEEIAAGLDEPWEPEPAADEQAAPGPPPAPAEPPA